MESKPKVLVIDDMHMFMFTLTHILKEEFTVFAADSGAEGLRIAKEEQPDIILLDIQMPGMDGYEVLTALKDDVKTKDIPVIFLTGQADALDEEQGLILGAADYITKPFSTHIVKLRIRKQLKFSKQENHSKKTQALDPLTNLLTRSHFDALLEDEWENAKNRNNAISLIIFNIDYFEKYNDTHGRDKGDEVLKVISQLMRISVEDTPYQISRWNGDEIAVILPNTSAEETRDIAEHLRITIDQSAAKMGNDLLEDITVSAGIHSAMPQSNQSYSVDDFVLDTTIALAKAKRIGRNNVYVEDSKI